MNSCGIPWRRWIREHILRLVFNLTSRRPEEKEELTELYYSQMPDEEITNPPLFASPQEKEYICQKAEKIIEMVPQIDEALNGTAKGWTTRRMGRTDLAILRLAVYEMLYDDEIPVGVAINEAIELAKQYCDDEAATFVNGILAVLVPGEKQ